MAAVQEIAAPGDSGPRSNTMVMSDVASEDPVSMPLTVRPAQAKCGTGQWKYVTQDPSFRIDVVTNGGKGDAEDYMLDGVEQERDAKWVMTRRGTVRREELQWWMIVRCFYF
jgi:hypothetical protein